MSAALCVTVLCVVAGCAAALPQQQQEQDLRPIIDRLESRLEALESYVTSRLDSHAARLDSHESRLEDLSDSPIEPASQVDGTANATTSRPTDTAHQRTGESQSRVRDCSDLPVGSPSGPYLLSPSPSFSQPGVQSRCDMDTDRGGWTVIHNRAHDIQPEQDFDLGWEEYKLGFGNVTGEFWWGLDNMWQLTSSPERQYDLRIDLLAFNGDHAKATYKQFGVSSEEEGYRLHGSYHDGTAGDSLSWANVGGWFMTRDKDHGSSVGGNCLRMQKLAPWWYRRGCGWANLNGRRLHSPRQDVTGIVWHTWKKTEALTGARMMIRPVNY